MSPKNDLASVVADAEWLPSHWDEQRDLLRFARVPRAMHAKVSFLAEQYLREIQPEAVAASVAEVAQCPIATSAPHYVFHSAFCCSTLLARALDAPGVSMGLNEPQILNQLALAALQQQLGGDIAELVVSLLGRPFGPGESVVIKPSNEANVLAPMLMQAREESRAIFLYAPLPRFLKSIANKGMWGRLWGRRLYALLARSTSIQLGLSAAELFELTDLQVSALAWLLHHAEGIASLTRFPGRVRTLDSETLLARKADALIALARHFALGGDEKQWKDVAEGPVFRTHSKEIGRSFDTEGRSDERLPPTIADEIAMVSKWAEAMAQHAGIALDMPPVARLLPPV